jgi:hypothetical protein
MTSEYKRRSSPSCDESAQTRPNKTGACVSRISKWDFAPFLYIDLWNLSGYHTDTTVLITALRDIMYPNDVEAGGKPVNMTQCHIKRSGTTSISCCCNADWRRKTVQTSITDLYTRPQRYSNANAEILRSCRWWNQLHSVTNWRSAWNTVPWQAVHNCISVFCKQTARSTEQLRLYYFFQPKLVNLLIFPSLTVQHVPAQHSWCLATAMTV